jgi:hypothetical protein|tara:strand:+ start:656 stop:1270 length:615 start_codon:yes stop_codon:yes gene_type:complete
MSKYNIERISYQDTKPFILDIHYAKRMPSISYAYGLFEQNNLIGMVSYGSPPSPALCKGIAGEENKSLVIELNRLVLKDNEKNQASYLIGASFKLLPKPRIIVSYADTEQDHIGIVYQATNFIYTGLSDKRKEWRVKGSNMHSKTVCETYSLEERKSNQNKFEHVDRPRKHRYIYFLGSKNEKKTLLKQLNYKIQEYPKKGQVR